MKIKDIIQFVSTILSILFALLPIFGIINYSIGLPLTFLFGSISISISAQYFINRRKKREKEIENKINALETKRESQPKKTEYSWELARIKLEAYFDRNLSQINSIFWISIIIMIVGFGFIIWGIIISINNNEILPITYTASIAGILTEFIGATFMLIYRSTVKQASQNMNVLERINQVGMAIQILDAIPDTEKKLQSETRAEITKLLLNMTK